MMRMYVLYIKDYEKVLINKITKTTYSETSMNETS